MLRVVEFFVAPDDGAVAGVGPRRRGHGFPAFGCADFFPDDAVEDWEVLLVGGVASDPRVVVPMRNDGFMVFELPGRLCSALAAASRSRLVEVAAEWVELAEAKDGAPAEVAVEILTEVADLARTAGDLGQPLYCWYFAP
ncbi:hypothetical protein [Streptomyces sp. TBY4]|uniref:hypothetical protein n=1 Tax=Streptomyces sp. TBY4 TaxID=2962030 RepID=UPI0020B70FCE|nr:hypothetical protein [Streptomyces sp. TBY4]MCP3759399.1 hypothetical protein [Streptomyces sp. TBY4]